MKATLWPVLLLVALSGCVSPSMPVPKGYAGPVATIRDTSTNVSGTKVRFFELAKVDGRAVTTSSGETARVNYGRGFAMSPEIMARFVPATKCVLRLQGVTHVAAPILAFGGGMYHVEGEVTVTLKPDATYLVKGELAKEYSAVWLEDEQGNPVSPRIEQGRKPAGP